MLEHLFLACCPQQTQVAADHDVLQSSWKIQPLLTWHRATLATSSGDGQQKVTPEARCI